MSKPTLHYAGRIITLEFPNKSSATKFILDSMGAIQKISEFEKSRQAAEEKHQKELEEKENKICYLENQLSKKIVECAFLKGEEPPAKGEETNDDADDEDAEIIFEEGEFEAEF